MSLALSCRDRCTKSSPAVEEPWDLCAGESIWISYTCYILYIFRGNGYLGQSNIYKIIFSDTIENSMHIDYYADLDVRQTIK